MLYWESKFEVSFWESNCEVSFRKVHDVCRTGTVNVMSHRESERKMLKLEW